jgi:hypothetical protein
MTVQFPEQAFNTTATGNDILPPLETLEQGLYILPTDNDASKAGVAATFQGPPQSVAIIEAGATALSKWSPTCTSLTTSPCRAGNASG